MTYRDVLFEAPLLQPEAAHSQGEAWGELESSGGYRSLPAAAADPRLAGFGGNYDIRWPKHVVNPGFYVGESNNLRRRLLEHAWHLSHLGNDPAKYQVRITNRQGNPNTPEARQQRKDIQVRSIANRQKRREPITNQRSSEFEYLFEAPLASAESEAEFGQWLRKTGRALAMAAGIGLSGVPNPHIQNLGKAIATAVSRTTKEGDEARERAKKIAQRDRGSAG
jgi:hypothetical protein